MPRSHGHAGGAVTDRASAVLARRTPARVRQCGRPNQTIGSKDVFANLAALAFGVWIAVRPSPWVRPRESVDAIGASLVAAQQSAPAWTCSNARRLRSARRAPARNW